MDDNQVVMTAVQAELKDFAKQVSETVANKFAQHETLIGQLIAALEAMDARIDKLESAPEEK